MKPYKHLTAAASIVLASGVMLTGCGSGATQPVDTNASNTSSNSVNSANGGTTNTGTTGTTNNSGNTNNSGSSSNGVQPIVGGTTGSAPTPVPVGPSANQSSPFPAVVQMAMGTFSSNILKGSEAPTILPWPSSGSTSVFYQTEQSTTPIMGYPDFISSYFVQLNSSTSKLGSFFGSRYSSIAGAQNAFSSGIGDVSSIEGTHSTIQIGTGHTGQLTVNQSKSSATIYWAEGLWKIQVNNVHSTVGPTDLAKEVVDYLDKNYMPVPKDKAAILVNLDGTSVNVTVTWLEDTELYVVTTTASSKNPVETALSMAIHMQAYS